MNTDPRLIAVQEANHYIAQNNPAQARKIVANILQSRIEELLKHPEQADQLDIRLILLVGDLSTILSDEKVADILYEYSADLSKIHGNERMVIFAEALRANAALQRGDIDGADNAIARIDLGLTGHMLGIKSQKALSDWEQKKSWLRTTTDPIAAYMYWVTARYLVANGCFSEAIIIIQRARYHCKTLPEKDDLLTRLDLDEAYFHLQCGKASLASQILDRYSLEVLVKNSVMHIRHIQLRARLALLIGDLSECRCMLEQLVEKAENTGQPFAFSQAIVNLIRFLILINQIAKARQLLEQYEQLISNEEENRVRPHITRLRALMDKRHLSSGLWKGVAPIYDTQNSEEHSEKPISSPSETGELITHTISKADDFENLFSLEATNFREELLKVKEKLPKKTKKLFDYITRRYGRTDSQLIIGRLSILHGITALKLRNITEALRLLENALKHLSKCDTMLDLWQCHTLLALCYRFGGNTIDAEKATISSYQILQKLSLTLKPTERNLFMLDKWGIEEDYLRLKIDNLNALTVQWQKGHFFSKSFLWIKAAKQLINIIDYSSTYKGAEVQRNLELSEVETDEISINQRPQSFWQFLLFHSPWRSTLSFIVLSDRTLVVSRSFLFLRWHVSPLGDASLRHHIHRWHKLSNVWWGQYSSHIQLPILLPSPDTQRHIRILNRISLYLADNLQLPYILKFPPWIKELKINADGALHSMPFAALPFKKGYLFEHFFLSYTFNLPNKIYNKKKCALLISVKQGFPPLKLPELPQTKNEARIIHKILKTQYQVTQFSDATNQYLPPHKQKVIDELNKCTLVHFACHGVFNAEKPFESGLVLLSSENTADILSVREIVQNGLGQTQHVVMSACYSADSLTLPGRWVISLPEAMCRAGAETVIGFMWPVVDEFGYALMKHYYASLSKKQPIQIVRYLRKLCLNDKFSKKLGLPLEHPYFWAALNIYTRK